MGLEESFFWLRYDLDGRPNYTLRHRLVMPMGDRFAVADREFYVSHGYNASQEIAGLVPVSVGHGGFLPKSRVDGSGGGFRIVDEKKRRTERDGEAANGDLRAFTAVLTT